MTLFKHTEPPKESGTYLCEFNSGERNFFTFSVHTGKWYHHLKNGKSYQARCDFWYSPSPPKEIDDVLDMISLALQARKDVIGSNIKFVALSFKEAETLLKLRAE